MEHARKQEILSRISDWLDDWPQDEPLPDGLDPTVVDSAETPDLSQLTAAVIAAAKEVQIQGRAFKRLDERLAELPPVAAIDARLSGIERTLAATKAGPAGFELEAAIDVHDRFARCVSEGRAAVDRLSRLARWAGAEATLRAIVDGFAASLERLTEALARVDVRPLETDGRPFDPNTMRAIDRVPADPSHPAGTVATTIRRGYLEGDRVVRIAEVRIAR